MGRFFRILLGVSLTVMWSSTVFGRTGVEEGTNPGLRITIRLYNFAGVQSKALTEAQKEATGILHEAGIQTRWVDCPLANEEASRYPACFQPSGPADLNLRILSEIMARRYSTRTTTFGFSIPCPEGERGCVANVFYHRVEDLARRGQISEYQVLGHALAHEIGHLLLGLGGHTSTGIMKANWDRDDLKKACLGHLLFAPDQSKLIRARVLKANELQACQASSTVASN